MSNPYRAVAGPELDATIHHRVLGGNGHAVTPPYSTDAAEARKLQQWLQARYRISIAAGRTRINGRNWFARYGTDPSTATEVLAATFPLAICRLALLLKANHQPVSRL